MNQHLRDGTLFKSPVGAPITELRDMGDKLALYTEDNSVLHRFRFWKQLIYLVPYNRQDTRGKEHFVGADLFFPKLALKQLIRELRGKPAATSKKGGSGR